MNFREMEKLKKKKLISVICLSLGLLATAGTTQAVYDDVSYKEYVGSFNGSASTAYQTKRGAKTMVLLNSYNVEGKYTVDARVHIKGGSSSGWTNIGDNEQVAWGDSNFPGVQERIDFSNGLLTPIELTITGSWRNN